MTGSGNGGAEAIGNWISRNAIVLLASIFTVASTFAIIVERAGALREDMKELQTSISARLDALNARMNNYERESRLVADKVLRTELELAGQDKAIAAIIAQRDARAEGRDDQVQAMGQRLAELEASDREQGQWRAALTERFSFMQSQLDRIAVLLEQRLPEERGQPRSSR